MQSPKTHSPVTRPLSPDPRPPTRLLIVERQPVVTPEVRTRLGREPGFAMVGRVASAVEATRLMRDQPLNMVLVESTLPEPGAVEMARFIRRRQHRTVEQ